MLMLATNQLLESDVGNLHKFMQREWHYWFTDCKQLIANQEINTMG